MTSIGVGCGEARTASIETQRRYWEHVIRDDRDFERHVDYIHWNPVKHGWVNRVGDWPHSSFHAVVRRGFYPADRAGNPEETIDGGE